MEKLPEEIINIICDFASMKYRNGMFMNQIDEYDERVIEINDYLCIKQNSIFGNHIYSLSCSINNFYIQYKEEQKWDDPVAHIYTYTENLRAIIEKNGNMHKYIL